MKLFSCASALCAALIGAFCLAVGGRSAIAQGGGWSPPFEVSSEIQFSWFPDIAVGPDNNVYIIWGSGENDPGRPKDGSNVIDLLRYRELRSGTWSAPNDILFTGRGGYTVRNSIVSGRDGRLHVIVRLNTNIFAVSAAADQALSAKSWSEPIRVSSDSSYYVELAVDSKSNLHALWSQGVPNKDAEKGCEFCSDLFYRHSADGGLTWSEPQNLSRTLVGENRPHLAIDGSDRVHAVWDEGFDWYVGGGTPRAGVYRRSDDGGQTWTPATRFTVNGEAVQQTTIATTSQGNPFVVFRSAESGRIYYQTSADGGDSWGLPGEIPGIEGRLSADSGLDSYALATDSRDQIHLLVAGFKPGEANIDRNPSLYHLAWNGTQWSAPKPVMTNELWPEWPQLAISNGNQLHATWFTRHTEDRFASDKGAHYQVWYSTLQLDAPSIAAPAVFTAVPTTMPSPTAPPATTPIATPLAVAARTAPTLDGSPAWEQRGLTTIVIAMAPVALLIAIASVVARRRRRHW